VNVLEKARLFLRVNGEVRVSPIERWIGNADSLWPMEELAALLVLLTLVGVAVVSHRLQRPKLEQPHLAIIALWITAWGLIILWWGSYNSQSGGWFNGGAIALFGLFAFVAGAGVMSVIALITRTISAETRTRSALLIGVPLLLVLWLYISFVHPQLASLSAFRLA
jgi:uncharacterized membrane protein